MAKLVDRNLQQIDSVSCALRPAFRVVEMSIPTEIRKEGMSKNLRTKVKFNNIQNFKNL